jgi:transposase
MRIFWALVTPQGYRIGASRDSEPQRVKVNVGWYSMTWWGLLPDMDADMLLADKAFDADERVIRPLTAAGKTAVIPSKANREQPREFDRHLYTARHLIENFFARLKQFRAIATRYDKTARNFLAAVHLAASAI